MEAATLLAIFFLLCLSLTPKGESANRGDFLPPAVLDVDGNELHRGQYYGIVSPRPDVLYTVSPLTNPNGTCWVQIETTAPITLHSSLPIRFWPVRLDDFIIREDTLIDIEFLDQHLHLLSVCGGSVWTVHDEYEPVFGQRFVNVGGKEEYRTTWFKIVRADQLLGHTYYLQFCPGFDSFDCQYVGVFWDAEGIGCLALAKDSPFPFAFSPLYRSQ